jgi:hypothetical protein
MAYTRDAIAAKINLWLIGFLKKTKKLKPRPEFTDAKLS